MSESLPSRRRNRWPLTAIKLLIVALVIWFIQRTLITAWEQLGEYHWHFSLLGLLWLIFAGVLYLAGTFFCGLFWHRVLRALGQSVGLGETLRAYYIGHLGKYVPGKAMVIVLRTGLIRGQRVSTELAAVSVFFETLTMMAVGAFLAAAIVAVWFRGQVLLFWASVAMMIVSGTPTFPPVFRRIVRLLGLTKGSSERDTTLAEIDCKVTLLGWLFNTIGWAFQGLSFWAVLRSMGTGVDNPFAQLHVYTASMSLATVAGFLSLVPGGTIVREAVLSELMKPQLGALTAVIAAVLSRLVQLVSELVVSTILYLGARRTPPPSGE